MGVLTKRDNAARLRSMVRFSEGSYTLPSSEELAAATAGAQGNASARPHLGCFIGPGLLMAGTPVGVIDGMADAGACCRACREDATCNVWTFCPGPSGCE